MWNVPFLSLVKVDFKERVPINCLMEQENHNLNKKTVNLELSTMHTHDVDTPSQAPVFADFDR